MKYWQLLSINLQIFTDFMLKTETSRIPDPISRLQMPSLSGKMIPIRPGPDPQHWYEDPKAASSFFSL